MHENHNLFLFLIKINNMHHTRHILPIPRTCIWCRCGRCGVSWHRLFSMCLCVWLSVCRDYIACFSYGSWQLVTTW